MHTMDAILRATASFAIKTYSTWPRASLHVYIVDYVLFILSTLMYIGVFVHLELFN